MNTALYTLYRTVATAYLTAKRVWSDDYDFFTRNAPRHKLPLFNTPLEASNFLQQHGVYTGDPSIPFIPNTQGAVDYYLHPERFQWGMDTGNCQLLNIDCDDYASWAFLALKPMANIRPAELTLVDAYVKMSHAVCGYTEFLGGGKARCGIIDTNGHHYVPDLTDKTICDLFNGIYASRDAAYCTVIDSGYPFND